MFSLVFHSISRYVQLVKVLYDISSALSSRCFGYLDLISFISISSAIFSDSMLPITRIYDIDVEILSRTLLFALLASAEAASNLA